MKKLMSIMLAALMAVSLAPGAEADIADGNYAARFTLDQNTGERFETPIPGHAWEDNGPNHIMRTFMDRYALRAEGGRFGWYSTSESEDWASHCETVPTLVYAASNNPFGNAPPHFFGGSDYHDTAFSYVIYYYEWSRLVPMDAVLPTMSATNVDDPTGTCLYFDRDEYEGFGQGTEDHPCATEEAQCKIGYDESVEIETGVGLSPSPWMYSFGPFRHFQLADALKLQILRCDLATNDPNTGHPIRPGQIVGSQGDSDLVLIGDGLGPWKGELIFDSNNGEGCLPLLDQSSNLINLRPSTSSNSPCGGGDCQATTPGAILLSQKAKDSWMAPVFDTSDRPFASTIAVMCAGMAGYYFDATEDPVNKGSPYGWLVAHMSDYDWIVLAAANDPEIISWGLEPANQSDVGYGNSGCQDFDGDLTN